MSVQDPQIQFSQDRMVPLIIMGESCNTLSWFEFGLLHLRWEVSGRGAGEGKSRCFRTKPGMTKYEQN